MEIAFFVSFSSFFLYFFILQFLETGKVNPPPPPPNGHARILANAEIYGRSVKYVHYAETLSIRVNQCPVGE